MQDYLNGLNDIQLKAVTHINGPLLVVAGPGSGKTRVLTYRIAHLIKERINPREILALTFTNKAAKEMKGRIEKVVGHSAHQVWAGTFHSIFAKILRVEAPRIGFPSNFTIYDTDDAKSLLNSIVKELGLDKNVYTAGSMLGRISSAKSQIITPEAYAANDQFLMQDKRSNVPFFPEIYKRYMNRLRKAGAMDFDDLLFHLFFILKDHPDVVEKYRNKFKYVLVDEFQDTNFLQYAIIKKLVKYKDSKCNICVVGDDAQSIYAFRGATIDNILDFEKDFPNLVTHKLEQNYRSTRSIVHAANEIIQHNKKQIQKKIWTDKEDIHGIQLIRALADTEEAKRVVDAIMEQRNRNHLRNSEIAILYRTNAQSRVFEEYLRRYNIPYRVYGGTSFYQRKEIKDLIAYFKLAINPYDDEALRRIINYPRRGIGDSTIDAIRAYATEHDITMWEVLQSEAVVVKGKKALLDFTRMFEIFMKKANELNAFELASMITRQSGIMELMKAENTMDSMARIENINSLLDGIKEFVDNDEITDEDIPSDKLLSTYLQNISLLTDADKETTDKEFITLMSVHAAKGLEFKSVFVTGLEEKLFPSWMSYDVPEGIDEERRLFYVAITRAETYLTLSYANSRYKFGKLTYSDPSRFLEEISIEGTDKLSSSKIGISAPKASISGSFKPVKLLEQKNLVIDGVNFKPSPSDHIKIGSTVLHLKFGEGYVKNIEGGSGNKVATIEFKAIDDPVRRIMLKFAKLQVLN